MWRRLDVHISIARCPNGVLQPVWTRPTALISYEQIQRWHIQDTEPRSYSRTGVAGSPTIATISEITQRTSHPSHVTARVSSNLLHSNNRLANERVVYSTRDPTRGWLGSRRPASRTKLSTGCSRQEDKLSRCGVLCLRFLGRSESPGRGRAGVAVAVEPMGANDDISLARFLVASRSAGLIGRGGWRNALRYECGSTRAPLHAGQ